MIILAIDTAANMCAACLYDTQTKTVLAQKSEDIGRGHAERLLSLIDECFIQAKCAPSDIDRIAVNVGPGSFTGIRVGVAAARGLALALDVTIVGVSTFAAIARSHAAKTNAGKFAVLLKGGRGQVFVQKFDADGAEDHGPFMMGEEDSQRNLLADSPVLIGNAAVLLDAQRAAPDCDVATGAILAYAELGMVSRLPANPLYLRTADAKVNMNFALPHAGVTKS